MSIRRITVLAASAALLFAVLGTIRGSHTPPIQTSVDGPTSMIDPYSITSAESRVELRVEVSLPAESFRVLQALNRSFMERHKDIVVRLRNLEPDSIYEVLGRAFRLGDTSDIMLLHNEKVMQYAVMAHLYPADDFFTSDTETEYLPAMTEQLRWNGYIWGVPFQIQPYIIAYHEQAWLESTGSAQPDNAEQILSAYAEGKLHIDEEDLLAYAAFAYLLDYDWQFPDPARWSDLETELDGELLDEYEESIDEEMSSHETEEPESDSGEGLEEAERTATEESQQRDDEDDEDDETLSAPDESIPSADAVHERTDELLVRVQAADSDGINTDPSMQDGGELEDGTQDVTDEDPWSRLASGEIMAMIAPLVEFERNQQRGISAVSVPIGDGQVFVSAQSFVLASEIEHHEAAFLWIREMTNSYNQVFMERSLGAYPANRTAYDYLTGPQLYFRLLRTAVANGRTLQSDLLVQDKLATVRELLHEPLPDEEIMTLMDVLRMLYQRFEDAGLIMP